MREWSRSPRMSWITDDAVCGMLYSSGHGPRIALAPSSASLKLWFACRIIADPLTAPQVFQCSFPYGDLWPSVVDSFVTPGGEVLLLVTGGARGTTRYFLAEISGLPREPRCRFEALPLSDNFVTGGFRAEAILGMRDTLVSEASAQATLGAKERLLFLDGVYFIPLEDIPRSLLHVPVIVSFPEKHGPFAFPIFRAKSFRDLVKAGLGRSEAYFYDAHSDLWVRFYYEDDLFAGHWEATVYKFDREKSILVNNGQSWRFAGPKIPPRRRNLPFASFRADLKGELATVSFWGEWMPSLWQLRGSRASVLLSTAEMRSLLTRLMPCKNLSAEALDVDYPRVRLQLWCYRGRSDENSEFAPPNTTIMYIQLSLERTP